MSKVGVSLLLALGLAGVVVVGALWLASGATDTANTVAELSALRQEVSAMRQEIRELAGHVRELHASQETLAIDVRASQKAVLPAPPGQDAVPAAADAPRSNVLKQYVAAVLEEERRVRDEERDREREEARERMDERRRELEALGEGPYDQYNLKVNSLGNVLGLTEVQKQAYFEVATRYRTKLEEGMKQVREQREAERAAPEEGDRDRRRRGGFADFEKYRELSSNLQKEFDAELQQILGAQQFETYGELSRSARSFQSRDLVSAPGEERRGFSFGGFGRGPGSSRRGR